MGKIWWQAKDLGTQKVSVIQKSLLTLLSLTWAVQKRKKHIFKGKADFENIQNKNCMENNYIFFVFLLVCVGMYLCVYTYVCKCVNQKTICRSHFYRMGPGH